MFRCTIDVFLTIWWEYRYFQMAPVPDKSGKISRATESTVQQTKKA
jgi:hypothetical protein